MQCGCYANEEIAELEAENAKLKEAEGQLLATLEYMQPDRDAWETAYGNLREKYGELQAENAKLRRSIDNIKVRSYELGQRELHDMALAALVISDE